MDNSLQFNGKWQRLTYMPPVGIGKNGARVTAGEAHIALARSAAAQGMVLLKNEEKILPFAKGQKLAVFGKAQADYVKGGGGSSDVNASYTRSVLDGLQLKEREGRIALFAQLSEFYGEKVRLQREEGVKPGACTEPAVPETLLNAAREFTDLALIIICRFSSESKERTGEKFDGDFYLSREETAMIGAVLSKFDKAAVVLNIGGIMDVSWFRSEPKIQSALLAWQAGMEGGLAIADVLCGDVNPSGHLTDTFADNFEAYPSSASFNDSREYVEYNEDIYVGYRYFETVPGAAEKVCYPFGYGLSYTTFEITKVSAHFSEGEIYFRVEVKNTGDVSGRQVVQIYCEAPQGKLGKPAKVLAGFQKTPDIAPGASETVILRVSPYAFSSYDDTGFVARSAYVLEKGDYFFHVGFHVRDTKPVDFVYAVEEDRVLKQLSCKCPPKQLSRRMKPDGSYIRLAVAENVPRPDDDLSILPFDGQEPEERTWRADYCTWLTPVGDFLMDVYLGKRTLDDFMELLTEEQKIHLLGGQPNRGLAIDFGFGNIPKYGIPNAMTADGPAGLRIRNFCGVTATAFPVPCLMACTWDPELVEKVGTAVAEEAYENGIGTLLAPAINIHRSPLCGRNFEYYSEDPLLAGTMAAAAVKGIQSRGVASAVKHFACNNKETNRRESDSRVSERAMREIYLKAFEIAVKQAQPWAIMSSYNMVNSIRVSENRELLTDILRGEWGFKGMVTTDWYTHGEQYREINAGNDMKMGCGMPAETYKALQDGRLSREALDTSVRRVLELLLKLA